MSRKLSVSLLTYIPMAVTMGFTFMALISEFTPSSYHLRSPASVKPSPLELMKPLMAHTEKLSSQIRTEISASSEKPTSGDEFKVFAKVTLPSSYDEVRLEWRVPPDLQVVSGQPTAVFTSPSAEEPLQVSLGLTAKTDENQQVHLLVSGRTGDVWVNETFQYNTTEQSSINEELKALAERNRKYLTKKGLKTE